MRIALVRDGRVDNVVEAPTGFTPPEGFLAIAAEFAGPGWLWDGAAFHEEEDAAAPVLAVSPVQIRRALRQAGLYGAVSAFVAAADPDVQDAWEYATEIDRRSPLIAGAAEALGKSEAEIDDLFRLASSL